MLKYRRMLLSWCASTSVISISCPGTHIYSANYPCHLNLVGCKYARVRDVNCQPATMFFYRCYPCQKRFPNKCKVKQFCYTFNVFSFKLVYFNLVYIHIFFLQRPFIEATNKSQQILDKIKALIGCNVIRKMLKYVLNIWKDD